MIRNPILRRELIARFRTRKPTAALVAAAVTILLLLVLIYWLVIRAIFQDPSPSAGADYWKGVVWVQYIVLLLIAPSIAANSISREREKQTWDMLIFSRLTPEEIVFGKLGARLASLLALMLAFLPIGLLSYGISAARNGISAPEYTPSHFLLTYLVMAVAAIFFTTVGLFLSWAFRRTILAIMGSYTVVIGILSIGTVFSTFVLSELFADPGLFDTCPLVWVNPVQMFVTVTTAPSNGSAMQNLAFGMLAYVVLTLIMLWRMIYGCRRFAME